MYIKPTMIELDSDSISEYINAYASSFTIGCPGLSANYVVGGGCGYIYNIGGCDISHNT